MSVHPDRWNPTNVLRKFAVVVHDSETSEFAHDPLIRVMALPGDRKTSSGSRYGSSYHAITDGRGGYTQILDAGEGPFAAPPLNEEAWHVCMPGRASFSREQWLGETCRNHIRGVARFIVDKARSDGIKLRRLTVGQLARYESGYCGHVDVRDAFGQTTHYDPGPNFPWDVLAADIDGMLNPPTEEDDVAYMVRVDGDDAVWKSNGVCRHWVQSEASVLRMGGWGAVRIIPADELQDHGAVIGPMPPGTRDSFGKRT